MGGWFSIRGGFSIQGVFIRGVSAPGGFSIQGGFFIRGVSAPGGFSMPGGGKENPPGWENPSPPVNNMNDRQV